MRVYLTNGVGIDVDPGPEVNHLYRSVLRLAEDSVSKIEHIKHGTEGLQAASDQLLHELCLCELFYLAGQMLETSESNQLGRLLSGFEAYRERHRTKAA